MNIPIWNIVNGNALANSTKNYIHAHLIFANAIVINPQLLISIIMVCAREENQWRVQVNQDCFKAIKDNLSQSRQLSDDLEHGHPCCKQ